MASRKEIFKRDTTKTILFVGNSLTYSNGLPGIVKRLGEENGIRVETMMIAHPDYALEDHWNDGQLQILLAEKHFDFVVLQQGPSSQEDGRAMLMDYGARIKSLCDKYKSKLAFFMVWPAYANFSNFDAVIKNYTDAATATNSLLCPVGKIWKAHFLATKDYAYYSSDKFHPSKQGSEAAARIIFETLLEGYDGNSKKNNPSADVIIQTSLNAVGDKTTREKIINLVSLAECISPAGKYTTEIHTATGGYSYFKQGYSYKPTVFEAVIKNKAKGYSIGDSIEPLNKETIYTIRSHEFHNMILEIEQRFHDFEKPEIVKVVNKNVYEIKAKDELNHACLLFFDVNTELLSAIHFQNPADTKEIIRISFSNWQRSQGLLLPGNVAIDQSGKMYVFNFISIIFNKQGFKYKNE